MQALIKEWIVWSRERQILLHCGAQFYNTVQCKISESLKLKLNKKQKKTFQFITAKCTLSFPGLLCTFMLLMACYPHTASFREWMVRAPELCLPHPQWVSAVTCSCFPAIMDHFDPSRLTPQIRMISIDCGTWVILQREFCFPLNSIIYYGKKEK